MSEQPRTSPVPDLISRNREAQVDLLVEWFFQNYEDPAERTPWDEGEYVYIWGQAYAREVLEEWFSKTPGVDDATMQLLIDAAVERIERDGDIWVPVPHESDYE